MRKLSTRQQRTLARPAEIQGVGYLTGADVQLRFVPAPAHTGIVFRRTDLPGQPLIPARLDNVTGTNRRTTLGTGPQSVGLVEHVLAALAGLHIDNCFLEVNAPEPPGLDGSAGGFVHVLGQAGIQLQNAPRERWTGTTPVIVQQASATLGLHPHNQAELRVSYFLDYGRHSPICWQTHTQAITPESFVNELATCRTFLLQEEALELQKQGLGKRTATSDLLIFGSQGPINNQLLFANEPARHKILDLVGDLALLGVDVVGHVVAYRSGHSLNNELARALARRMAAAVGKNGQAA